MPKINCAIYTRKSTEHGLDMEFNSLQNQEESCKAYILSQAFNGWEYYKNYSNIRCTIACYPVNYMMIRSAVSG